jgi:hypothetical protein
VLVRARSELEVARGWSAADDAALQRAARQPAVDISSTVLRGRRAADIDARCRFLGCVVPRSAPA